MIAGTSGYLLIFKNTRSLFLLSAIIWIRFLAWHRNLQEGEREHIRKEKIMEVKDYCRNVEMELTSWKSKLYDIIRKMDSAPTGNKEKIYEDINGLHILMTELEDRLDNLRTSCPTEWSPEEKEIRVKLSDLENRYKDASKVLFDYDFGG